ncbi:ATP-grasp domain-containing protein [Actinotalea ferrariae]|uniref:ATP-grasp domain-containing protein n=1 Tax=Actinotalea ferrariae TaxID=1386098 RepID=UPI001C8B3070|nr:ATP-grasp domain-containing protein [Actinotalea ferrariae]MBX9244350.1 ATP-grasp domain-containing protein [Actinotalea ferrariae]
MSEASTHSSNARPRVFVLHSRQPLTTNPAESFPPDRFEVVVLTDADPATVLREDVEGPVGQVVHAGRDAWESVVRSAPAGAVEVVTNDEYCLAECARLRATTGLPARHPAHLDGYRDKVLMKRRLEAAGVPVPRYLTFEPAVTSSRAVADRVVAAVGLPAVVKPRREANSRGVEVLDDVEAVLGWLARHDGETGWQVDEFVDGTLGHVNALVRQGDVRPVQVGRYLGPLLGLDHGRVLGGWTVPADTPEAVTAHELNGRVVRALGSAGEFVVHTEFATTPDGRLVVLETAARAPGASVSELARVHAGVQLEVANLRLQAGLPVPEPDHTSGRHAAWLWLPVMPGRRWGGTPDAARGLGSDVEVHVRRVGRDGNIGTAGQLGAAVLLTNTDRGELANDVDVLRRATWFPTAEARGGSTGRSSSGVRQPAPSRVTPRTG